MLDAAYKVVENDVQQFMISECCISETMKFFENWFTKMHLKQSRSIIQTFIYNFRSIKINNGVDKLILR